MVPKAYVPLTTPEGITHLHSLWEEAKMGRGGLIAPACGVCVCVGGVTPSYPVQYIEDSVTGWLQR